MRFQSYFNTAIFILQQYDGSMPLLHFLKQYFSQHKKHGSKDRKWISHLCYNYYRLGHALKELAIEERLRIALFLCNESAGDWQILYEKNWIDNWESDLTMRIGFIQKKYPSFTVESIFPWGKELSGGIDQTEFILSHFIQPDLFLRIRPGKEKVAIQKLTDQQIPFQKISPTCLSLPNASKIDKVLTIDNEVVVQDYSSQRIQEFLIHTTQFLQLQTPNSQLPTSLWDCCAASGGKSILAYDTIQNSQLTVSDLRPAILRNLKERFEQAGIKNYHSFIADLSTPNFQLLTPNSNPPTPHFHLILCDAPCTGSGTWGRTPEQLYFFTEEKINEYASLQRKIVGNILPHLADNGFLLYITCSIFREENEGMVSYMQQQLKLSLVKMELLKGYDKKADSMFAALFSLQSTHPVV
ncbi:MAG: Fmu (Sun) domain-containing protein [Sediminibacterium sp.]|nr:Fmu (Sun) domain-containing protein [Sediminibacterium sp.]